ASATSLTVTSSQTVSNSSYTINYPGLNVASSGNVGIGSTSPDASLTVEDNGAGKDTFILVSSQDKQSGLLMSEDNSMTALTAGIVYDATDNKLYFKTGPGANRSPATLVTQMTIDRETGE